jgi:hypothetical protein
MQIIVSQLFSGRRIVVKFRHSSWWNEKVYQAHDRAASLKERNESVG